MFYSNNYNLNIICLRLCSIFGPGLNRQIIYEIIKKLKSKKSEVNFLGNHKDEREFLYIADLVDLLNKLRLKKIKSGIYNIGSDQKIKIGINIQYLCKRNNLNKK